VTTACQQLWHGVPWKYNTAYNSFIPSGALVNMFVEQTDTPEGYCMKQSVTHFVNQHGKPTTVHCSPGHSACAQPMPLHSHL
jgi:hypothetical protein